VCHRLRVYRGDNGSTSTAYRGLADWTVFGRLGHEIGLWEANHVWLIFIFVILWTSFPEAYASIRLTLFVPLTIAALGIVLRGASFAFRKSVISLRYRRISGPPSPRPLYWCPIAWAPSPVASPPDESQPVARLEIR